MAGPLDPKASRLADPAKGRLRALLYLACAVAAALGTAVLLTRYMDTRIAAVRVPTTKVVVAASDLAIATPLESGSLATVDWPRASVPLGTYSDPKELVGKVVNANIAKGEAILLSKVASGDLGSSALATVLTLGMRAVSVRVDDVVGVAGFIHPGDHVDVIVTMSGAEAATSTSKIILQNIKVLAVGKEVDGHQSVQKPAPATVATLMVDSEQAERLALAAAKGQLLLALRSSVDSEVVETQGVAPLALVGGPAPVRRPDPPPPEPVHEKEKEKEKVRRVVAVRPPPPPVTVAAPTPPPPKDSKMVEILRGDLFEKRDFQNQKESNP